MSLCTFQLSAFRKPLRKEGMCLKVSMSSAKVVAGNVFSTSKNRTLSFKVNRHLVYSMRSIGKGHCEGKTF